MSKSVVLCLLILLSGVLANAYIVEVSEDEEPVPEESIEEEEEEISSQRPAEFGPKFSGSLDESAIKFMMQWINKARDGSDTTPEFLASNSDMVGNLFNRFKEMTPVAEIAHHPYYRRKNIKPSSMTRMWFSEFGIQGSLVHSEIRFYREFRKHILIFFVRSVKVSVFRILEDNKFLFVNSTILPVLQSGWFSVEITDLYKDWMAAPEKNFGVKIVVTFVGNDDLHFLPESLGIIDFKNERQKHPFLINFFDKSKASEGYFEKLFWEKLMASADQGFERKKNDV